MTTVVTYPAHYSLTSSGETYLSIPDFPECNALADSKTSATAWASMKLADAMHDYMLDRATMPYPTLQPEPAQLVAPDLRHEAPGTLDYNAILQVVIPIDPSEHGPTLSFSSKIPSKDV